MKSDVFIFSNRNSFRSLSVNGIDLEVRQGERIGPSYICETCSEICIFSG